MALDLTEARERMVAEQLEQRGISDQRVLEAMRDVPRDMSSIGEIVIRGDNVMDGYFKDPEGTKAVMTDGWFHSGDIAVCDADGYFTIHDRKKNMIVSGGENVYPAEVERVLLEHAAVAEAAVIGIADPRWQEVPMAFVVLRSEMQVTAAELRAFTLSQLARFKVPREFIFVEDLPRNALGKVQHYRLKETLRSSTDW